MRHVKVSSVACPALPYFSTLHQKQHDFQQGVIKHKMWVFIFPTTSETFLILRVTHRDIIINVHVLHLKYPSFLSYFNENWIFSIDFRKILKCQIYKSPSSRSRVVPCRPKDERTDRQTDKKDMKKLVVAFRNSTNSPKNVLFCRLSHAPGCNLCRSIPASFDVVRIQSRTRDLSNGLFRCKPATGQWHSHPSTVID